MSTHRGCLKTKAMVINGKYISGCSKCLNTTQIRADYANKYRREHMKRDNAKDLVQRYDGEKINPEWVKLHERKALEAFGEKGVEDIIRSN